MPLLPSHDDISPELLTSLSTAPFIAVIVGSTGMHPYEPSRSGGNYRPRARAIALTWTNPSGIFNQKHILLDGLSPQERAELATAILKVPMITDDAGHTLLWLRDLQYLGGFERTAPPALFCALQLARIYRPAIPLHLSRLPCREDGDARDKEWASQIIKSTDDRYDPFGYDLNYATVAMDLPWRLPSDNFDYHKGRNWSGTPINMDAEERLQALVTVTWAIMGADTFDSTITDKDALFASAMAALTFAAIEEQLSPPHLAFYLDTIAPVLPTLVQQHENGVPFDIQNAKEQVSIWRQKLEHVFSEMSHHKWARPLLPFREKLTSAQMISADEVDQAWVKAIQIANPNATIPTSRNGNLSLSSDAVRLSGLHIGETAAVIRALEQIKHLKYLLSNANEMISIAHNNAMRAPEVEAHWGVRLLRDFSVPAADRGETLKIRPQVDAVPPNLSKVWIAHSIWANECKRNPALHDPMRDARMLGIASGVAAGQFISPASTLYVNIADMIDGDKRLTRIHPKFSLTASTDRTLSHAPTTQNQSNDPDYRRLFSSRPGYSATSLDWSQQELRGAAGLALRAQEQIFQMIESQSTERLPIGRSCIAVCKAIFSENDIDRLSPRVAHWEARVTQWENALYNFMNRRGAQKPCELSEIPSSYQGIKDELDLCKLRVYALRVRINQLRHSDGQPHSNLRDAYKENLDVHLITGLTLAQLEGHFVGENTFDVVRAQTKAGTVSKFKTIWSKYRDFGKPVNFSLIYGITVESLYQRGITKYELEWQLNDVAHASMGFFSLFPEIGLWQMWTTLRPAWEGKIAVKAKAKFGAGAEVAVKTKRAWAVSSLYGRTFICTDWRTALNSQNQGNGAHMLYTALNMLGEDAKECLSNGIHDETVSEIPLNRPDIADEIKTAMITAGDRALGKWGIPTQVEIESTPSELSIHTLPPVSAAWLHEVAMDCPKYKRKFEQIAIVPSDIADELTTPELQEEPEPMGPIALSA